jgi:DNA polymerase-3 subunit epsilon
MHWRAVSLTVVDFEGALASGVVEYGVAVLREGCICNTATRLCRPSGVLRREDIALHGIDDAATAGKPPLSDDWELFAGWRQHGPMVAHFAGTENALLKSVWPYARRSPDFSRPGHFTNDWGPWIDTGRLLPRLFRGLVSAKLEDLVGSFGLGQELDELAARHCPEGRRRYHAALYDALATALLLRVALLRPEYEAATVPWLVANSSRHETVGSDDAQGVLF